MIRDIIFNSCSHFHDLCCYVMYVNDFFLKHSSSLLSQNQVPHEGKSFDVSNSKVTYREPTNSKSQPSQSIGASSSHSQERIIQPKDENEALACLVSANYLCGYYAGMLLAF